MPVVVPPSPADAAVRVTDAAAGVSDSSADGFEPFGAPPAAVDKTPDAESGRPEKVDPESAAPLFAAAGVVRAAP